MHFSCKRSRHIAQHTRAYQNVSYTVSKSTKYRKTPLTRGNHHATMAVHFNFLRDANTLSISRVFLYSGLPTQQRITRAHRANRLTCKQRQPIDDPEHDVDGQCERRHCHRDVAQQGVQRFRPRDAHTMPSSLAGQLATQCLQPIVTFSLRVG
jgi:hypothetical protein